MRESQHRLLGFVQRVYITWDTFLKNDLFSYASAGAYSFLLSALPVVLMVLIILIRIFGTSPDVIRELLSGFSLFSDSLNISFILDSVTSIKSFGIFEIILGFSIFWMARRFFASIQQSMTVIYRKRGKGKPIKENLIVIAGEVILVILIVIMTVALMTGNAIYESMFTGSTLHPAAAAGIDLLVKIAPYGILATFLWFAYFFTPRTRPSAQQSLFVALACTITFALVQSIFASFVSMSKYNLVYGILSNMIVLLLEVYIFFVLFLFYAEFQYVCQFFDSYLLVRLYLLPRYNDPNPFKQIIRSMFVNPPRFYRRWAVAMKAGSIIFREGERSTDVYYVWSGAVQVDMINQVIDLGRGSTFGEFSSIAGGTRTATAKCISDCTLLKIPAVLFRETVEVDADMSRRTLLMISDYVRKKNKETLPADTEL